MRVKVVALTGAVAFLSACSSSGSVSGLSHVSSTPTTPKSNIPIPKIDTPSPISFSTNFEKTTNVDNAKIVPRPSLDVQKEIQKAIANTNKLRAEKGLRPLVQDDGLMAYAQLRAKEIEKHFSHNRPDGQSYAVGVIGSIGENIAAGHGSADKTVLEQWRNSTGHYNNMIMREYTTIGIGMVHIPNSTYGYYWVQIFGYPNIQSLYQFGSSVIDATNNQPLTTLKVDGKSVSLSHVKNDGTWASLPNHQGAVAGYQNSRFGVVKAGGTDHVFYQGLQTPESKMPKSGKVNYEGVAVVSHANSYDKTGKVALSADFSRKTLTGKITAKTTTNINADIKGNAFESKPNSQVQTQGTFFGDKAQEVSGVFKDNTNNTKGAFGAVKKP